MSFGHNIVKVDGPVSEAATVVNRDRVASHIPAKVDGPRFYVLSYLIRI